MQSNHTPGPWTPEEKRSSHFSNDYWHVVNGNDMYVAAAINVGNESEYCANARLIAAAPDLLAALEECVTDDGAHCLAYGTDTQKMRARLASINAIARSAIARARGTK